MSFLRENRWGLVTAGLAFVLSAALILAHRDYAPLNDSKEYALLTHKIQHGHGFTRDPCPKPTAFRSPLYPLFLSGAFGATDSQTAARLATAALGALAVFLLFVLVRSLWGVRAATAASALAAISPALLASSTGFFTEPLFMVLELGALIAALRFRERPRGMLLPAAVGLLCGLSALTRSNGWLMLIPLVPALALSAPARRRGIVAALVALLVAAVTVAPWAIRNEKALGHLTISTQSGYALIYVFNDLARGHNGDYSFAGAIQVAPPLPDGQCTNEADFGKTLVDQSVDYGRAHPAYVIKAEVLNTLRTLGLWSGTATGFSSWGGNGLPGAVLSPAIRPASYLLYLLAAAGLLVLVTGRMRRPPLFLFAVPVLLLLSPGLTAGALRYRVPFDPVVLALAGLAVADVMRRRREALDGVRQDR